MRRCILLLVLCFVAACGGSPTSTQPPTTTPLPTITSTVRPSPTATWTPTPVVDPHVEIDASVNTIHVSETLTVTGRPVDIGLPNYYLFLRVREGTDPIQLARVTYANETTVTDPACHVLQFASAEGAMDQATFVLQACAPGAIELWINATGEVHYGYPGPATWSGGGSEAIQISVAE